jgi:hypothetical protein
LQRANMAARTLDAAPQGKPGLRLAPNTRGAPKAKLA